MGQNYEGYKKTHSGGKNSDGVVAYELHYNIVARGTSGGVTVSKLD